MSAGSKTSVLKVSNDLSLLAPKFEVAVRNALDACEKAGLEAMVYEACRSQALQALYYARGRTIIPPKHTVTNAPSNLHSWHGYGLAVDVVHKTKYWNPSEGEQWFEDVADIFKQHECSWGGDWKHADTPHFQWHKCKPSPSDQARALMLTGGQEAVWKAVGAA